MLYTYEADLAANEKRKFAIDGTTLGIRKTETGTSLPLRTDCIFWLRHRIAPDQSKLLVIPNDVFWFDDPYTEITVENTKNSEHSIIFIAGYGMLSMNNLQRYS